jgi:hypothetical protein
MSGVLGIAFPNLSFGADPFGSGQFGVIWQCVKRKWPFIVLRISAVHASLMDFRVVMFILQRDALAVNAAARTALRMRQSRKWATPGYFTIASFTLHINLLVMFQPDNRAINPHALRRLFLR